MSINRNKVLDAARKYQARGQYDKAIAQYQKLVDADKGDCGSRSGEEPAPTTRNRVRHAINASRQAGPEPLSRLRRGG